MRSPRHARPADPIRLDVWRPIAALGLLATTVTVAVFAAESRGQPAAVSVSDTAADDDAPADAPT